MTMPGGATSTKIKCMTFPRSGHALLANMLCHYFTGETLTGRGQDGLYVSETFTYCFKYRHCRAHPCSDPRTVVQKDHDFHLDVPVSASMKHVVQYRHPINSLMSWYLWALERKTLPVDSRKEWEAFGRRKIEFWKGFVDKWVLRPVPNRVVIRYEDLVERPEDRLGAALEALGGPADGTRVRSAVRVMNVSYKNQASGFRYFDRSYNALICRMARPQLQALGYAEDNYK